MLNKKQRSVKFNKNNLNAGHRQRCRERFMCNRNCIKDYELVELMLFFAFSRKDTRNIAKILLKTSRRSDIVAHYGDGCFAMVMKHTDLESAKKASQRVAELLYQTTFFMGEDELDMNMEISVGAINPDSSIEEILSALLDALPNSGKGVKLFESVEV